MKTSRRDTISNAARYVYICIFIRFYLSLLLIRAKDAKSCFEIFVELALKIPLYLCQRRDNDEQCLD